MFVQVSNFFSGSFFQFRNTTEAPDIAVFTLPNWKRSTPETVSTDGPVTRIIQPFSETSVTNVSWHPMYSFVVSNHSVFYCLNIYKPCRNRFINQGCICTPAKWIAVLCCLMAEHFMFFFQALDNRFIGIFDIHSCDKFHVIHKIAFVIHWIKNRYIFSLKNPYIVFSKTG